MNQEIQILKSDTHIYIVLKCVTGFDSHILHILVQLWIPLNLVLYIKKQSFDQVCF